MIFLRKFCKNRTHFKGPFFGFIWHAFNVLDAQRLAIVGPDRLCAEWILKNGGSIRFKTDPENWFTEYNELPEQSTQLTVKEIDASNTGITGLGFEHFRGCHQIDNIILHQCASIENAAINKLEIVAGSLKSLQISYCANVQDTGLSSIKQLINLEKLICFNLPQVKNLENVQKELSSALPNCDIIFGKKNFLKRINH